MGFKGKKPTAKKSSKLGGIASAAKSALGGGGSQQMGQSGTFRVDRFGNITKIQQKRRRKGYRMPRALAEQMRAQNDMIRNIGTAVVLGAVSHK